MAVESPEDRAIFFDSRDFGEADVLYKPRGGEQPYYIDGIYDEPTKNFQANQWPGHSYQMQEGAGFVLSGPTFTCATSSLVKGGRPRDKLTIEGTVYVVQKVMRDGTGLSVLELSDDDDAEDPA